LISPELTFTHANIGPDVCPAAFVAVRAASARTSRSTATRYRAWPFATTVGSIPPLWPSATRPDGRGVGRPGLRPYADERARRYQIWHVISTRNAVGALLSTALQIRSFETRRTAGRSIEQDKVRPAQVRRESAPSPARPSPCRHSGLLHLPPLHTEDAEDVLEDAVFDCRLELRRFLVGTGRTSRTTCSPQPSCLPGAKGSLPAPEAAHAIYGTLQVARATDEEAEERTILFNFSGHGHFDTAA
jgi:hypothetical protein